MKILVGIPTHKRPELLRECLASIAGQSGDLPEIAVFVADNDFAGREGLKVVEEIAGSYRFPISATPVEEPGISAVRNAILAEARRTAVDFVAMIDDDVRADEQWLVRLLRQLREDDADAAAGPVFYEFEEAASEPIRRAFWTDPRQSGPFDLIYATTGVLISASILCKTRWPLFDPVYGLTGGGDKEWFTRLARLGARFTWAADARVTEFVASDRSTRDWLLRRRFRIGIDDIRISKSHAPWWAPVSLVAEGIKELATAPAYIPRLFGRDRYVVMGRWATAVGRLSAVFGKTLDEYAPRHYSARSSIRETDAASGFIARIDSKVP